MIEIDGMMKDLLFWDLMYLHLAFSKTCGYSLSKFCIFNSPKSIISDIFPDILCVLFTSQLEPIHYLQKIDIRILAQIP